jgi:predicted dehydrogenase
MTIGFGIIGLGEAGQHHLELIGTRRPVEQISNRLGLLGKGRRVARYLLGRERPTVPEPSRDGIDGSKLIAVSDVDENRLAWAKENFDVAHAYTDYRALLARKDVDAVLICTPPMMHPEITAEAARQGKHVFCEKPLAMTSQQCREMMDVTEKAGVILQVGYMLRFSSERRQIADAIRNNEIGRPVFFREIMSLRAGGPQAWIHDQELGGGPLWEVSHCIDFIRYVFGEPDLVFAIGGHFKPNKTSAVDTYAVSLTFPSGDKALLCDSYAIKNFGWEHVGCRDHRIEIDVVGPGGFIQFPDADLAQRLTICRYGDREDRIDKLPWTSEWGENGYRDELQHFVVCIQQKKTPDVSGYEGLRTVQLAETILHSIRTGEVSKFGAPTQMLRKAARA